jgi:hypothetical protein
MSLLVVRQYRLARVARLLPAHGPGTRPSRWSGGSRVRRAGLAALTLAAAAVSACSAPAPVALPARPAAAAAAPAALGGPPQTPRQQAVAAYDGYWQAFGQAMSSQSPAAARSILAGYVPASQIPAMIRSYRPVWAAHDVAYGAAVTHVLSVQISGRRAILHDCLDLSRLGVQDRSGRVLPQTFGQPKLNFYITLLLSRGRWLVGNMQPVEVPCEP